LVRSPRRRQYDDHEAAKITPAEGTPYQHFGYAGALSGNPALIGSYGYQDGSGTAFVYTDGSQ
jgi:hypothetical protein